MKSLLSRRNLICGLLVAALVVATAPVLNAQNAPCYQYDENCKGILKKTAIVGGSLVGAIVVWKIISGSRKSAKAKAAANRAPDRLNVNYQNQDTNGEVDYRLEAIPKVDNCPGTWRSGGVELANGKLPPAVKLSTGDDGMLKGTISGTPLAPGTWSVGVRFTGLTCEDGYGRTKYYDDQITRVTINVK